MKSHTFVAIMAGGVGSRFWPASRSTRPKQFLDILGLGKTLIQLTYERFLKLCPGENIFIITNGIYKELVKEQLSGIADEQILCEPSRNNTAPCVAYTAFKLNSLDPEANMVVAPSDHIILDEANFLASLRKGLDFTATHDALLTLGIQPTRPDTGYGYIHYQKDQTASPSQAGAGDICKVIKFTEKPPPEKAEAFLAGGDYLWNAGIFVWRVEAILKAFEQYAPEISTILQAGASLYNTPEEQRFIDEKYPTTPSISIDFAIMEKAGNVYTIPSSFGWSDLGTWASLHLACEKDPGDNVVQSENSLLFDTEGCIIRAPVGKLVAIKGLNDYIVVDEGNVLLIFPKSEEQHIKQITEKLGSMGWNTYL